MLSFIRPPAAAICLAGTLSTVIGFCGLFVQNAPVIKKDQEKFEQIKTMSEYAGFGGAALFALTFDVLPRYH